MDIQTLHMQNVAYQDLIADLKRNINELDRKIQANEMEIGRQLEDMQQPHVADGCTLCLGECNGNE